MHLTRTTDRTLERHSAALDRVLYNYCSVRNFCCELLANLYVLYASGLNFLSPELGGVYPYF